MPKASSAFTNDASEKRGGGSVKCCSLRSSARSTISPFSSGGNAWRSEEHTSELQSRFDLVCRLLLEKKNKPYSLLWSYSISPSALRHRGAQFSTKGRLLSQAASLHLMIPFTVHLHQPSALLIMYLAV